MLIKQLADQEIVSNQHKTLLESVRKEADTLKVKLSGTVTELKQKTQTCFKQEQEIADLSLKARNMSGLMKKEKDFAIREIKTKFEMELQETKLSLVNKQLTIKEKEEQLLKMQSELQDKSQQAKRLNEMSDKVAKLEIDNQKAHLECRELKIVEKENAKKSEAVKADNKRLQRKYDELKNKRAHSGTEYSTEDVILIKRENLDLKSKLAIQEKTLRAEIDRLLISKKKTEKKISKMERKMKDAEDKISSSSEHEQDTNNTVRKLERENRRLKEDDQYNRKLIEDLRDERNKMNDQMRSSESEARRDVEKLKDRIKVLENELMDSKKMCDGRQTSNEKKLSLKHQVVQNDDDDRYSYDDDFEPESIAEDVSSRTDDKDIKSITTEKSDSAEIQKEEDDVSDHSGKYNDDKFEEESVATQKSFSSKDESLGNDGSVLDGEACEESVPEIESDSDKDGLFFGSSSKNVNLDIPKFTPSVVSTSFNNNNNNNNNNNSKSRATVEVQQQLQPTKSLVTLSDAPLLIKKQGNRKQKSIHG